MTTANQLKIVEEDEQDVESASIRWDVTQKVARDAIEQIMSWKEDDHGFDTYMADGGATAIILGNRALVHLNDVAPSAYMPMAA